ncbi:M15 family metallopeptidase [Nocardioides sp. KR10-350]|uniref:M15 family metallopeptidase n=1 Tax=Nocardioides cheoyonin TaxID=3156615 RepID=UPI0032B5A041
MLRPLLVVPLALSLLAACGGEPSAGPSSSATITGTATGSPTSPTSPTSPSTTPSSTPSESPSSAPSSSGTPALGTYPPDWLGTRVLPRDADGYGRVEPTPAALRNRRFTLPDQIAELPGSGFASRVERAPADVIARSTWAEGCPVKASQLSWIRLTFWGFDDRRHTGELLVNSSVADDVVEVFRQLYAARFPLEQMHITTKAERDAPPTGDGNNTGAFNCRPAIGTTSYSQHAYGLAIDVDPFQNPYVDGDRVLPELASAYVDRDQDKPGMIHPGDAVTRAFASVGWGWGGDWHTKKDWEHFSVNGT